MEKKAQLTIGFLGGILVFIILFSFFAPIIGEWSQIAIVNGNMTGTEALLYSNINFFIVIGIILMIFAFATFSAGN